MWLQRDDYVAVNKMVKEYTSIYIDLLKKEKECENIRSSKAYRLGKILLRPFKWLRK
jgi:hypothetical protein